MSANVAMRLHAGKYKAPPWRSAPPGICAGGRELAEDTERDRELMRAVNAELEFRERHGE